MIGCPDCNGKLVGHGSRNGSVLSLFNGRISRVPSKLQRFRCQECGTVKSNDPVTREAISAIVDAVFREGFTGAANALGCDRSTVRSVYRDWLEVETRNLPARLPGTIGVHVLDTGRSERIIVADLVEGTLVEVFDDHTTLGSWLETMPGEVTLAAIDIDARTVAVMRRAFPGIEIAVVQSAAREAIIEVAQAAFRSMLRQGADKGRNFREDANLLHKSDSSLSDDEHDELRLWSPAARVIRRTLSDIATAMDEPAGFAVAVDRSKRNLATAAAPGNVGMMLSTWEPAITAGIGKAWMDKPFGMLVAMGKGVLALDTRPEREPLRALLLFSGGADRYIEDAVSSVARFGNTEGCRDTAFPE